jgi:hypothetical protein
VPCVYSAGHIRRRISHQLIINNIGGRSFYELSTPAGGCCSGAPVSRQQEPFRVIGVYVGERRSKDNTFVVGFAPRSEVLAQRWPQLVAGTTDLSELCPFDGPGADWTGPRTRCETVLASFPLGRASLPASSAVKPVQQQGQRSVREGISDHHRMHRRLSS